MTAKNVNDSPNRTTPQEQPEKPFLPFSIENILRKDFKCRNPVQENSPTVHQVRSKKTPENEASAKSAENIFIRLPWLAYTRYCPPKIPSKFLVEFASVLHSQDIACSRKSKLLCKIVFLLIE